MKTYSAAPRADVYSKVTDRIVQDLENGVRPWLRPWSAGNAEGRITMPLRHNGTPYRGINILLLWGETMAKGFTSSTWMTYNQAAELKAFVRKGEHGSLVVYADRFRKTETDGNGQDIAREIPFLKAYTVFNVQQVEGLPDHYYELPAPKAEKMQLIEHAEAFFAATGAVIRHGGNQAYYSPTPDVVVLPVPEAFKDAESYEATKAHELVHWTGHASRLNREFPGGKRFGQDGYAFEELCAELGSAFLCGALDITPEVRDDHASYLASWLKVLKTDKRAIFAAASHAQKAVDFLHALQPPSDGS